MQKFNQKKFNWAIRARNMTVYSDDAYKSFRILG